MPAAPHRRRVTAAAAVAAALAAFPADLPGLLPAPTALEARAAARPPRPGRHNVLLISVASLRADRLGTYTAGARATPAIDSLAARGVRFERAYAASPSTVASTASLLTGVYPLRHGLRHDLGERLADGVPPLAEAFQRAGYRTGAVVGTFHLDSDRGLGRGFDAYDDDIKGIRKMGVSLSKERRADEVVGRGLAWLDGGRRGTPFFLWLDFYDPHYDHEPPAALKETFASDPYQGEIAHLDAQIGVLTAALRDRGLEDSTHVVFAGTHGEGLGDHGETGHGLYIYETTIRVPLIVAAAGGAAARGRTHAAPVSLVDIAPTLLELNGLAPRKPSDGRSLAPILAGAGAAARDADRMIFIEAFAPFAAAGWSPMYAVVNGDRKATVGTRTEAFDLAADPGEGTPLAPLPGWAGTLAAHGRPLLGSWEAAEDLKTRVRRLVDDLDPPWNYSPICMEKVEFPDPRDRIDLEGPLFRARVDSYHRVVGRAARIAEEEVLPKDRANYTALELAAGLALRNGWTEYLFNHLEIMQCNYPCRPGAYHFYAHHLEKQGDRERAEKALLLYALLDAENEEPYYDLAVLYAQSGRPDLAFENLEKSIRYGAEDLDYIRRDVRLKSLRDDPRFASLVGPVAGAAPSR
jgi:arylsulfatase A-like enzyme